MLKRFSDLPAPTSPSTAPDSASGRMVSTVTGWRNELNWLASTMYATSDADQHREREAARRLLELRRLTAGDDARADRERLAELVDLGHRLRLRVARRRRSR